LWSGSIILHEWILVFHVLPKIASCSGCSTGLIKLAVLAFDLFDVVEVVIHFAAAKAIRILLSQ
jgi:hypothetical protein